jgi:uncharacterized protein YjbI with pentapeptide repeats
MLILVGLYTKVGADMTGADMPGADLAGADPTGADMPGADLAIYQFRDGFPARSYSNMGCDIITIKNAIYSYM